MKALQASGSRRARVRHGAVSVLPRIDTRAPRCASVFGCTRSIDGSHLRFEHFPPFGQETR